MKDRKYIIMKYKLFVVILFLNCINIFGQKELEIKIISDLIIELFPQKPNDTIYNRKGKIKKIRSFQKPQIVLITETDTSHRYHPYSFEYFKEYLKSIDSVTHSDFLSNNKTILTIDSIHGFDGNITYLTNSEVRQIFDKRSWTAYHKQYGYNPLVRISRPGINTNKNLALAYCSWTSDELAGIGIFLILEKVNEIWIGKEWLLAWKS